MSSINPVVLFGDVGPEVVTLSQIYDPDNDEYILSQDRKVWDTSKKYYTRTYSNKTVTFTQVTGSTSGASPVTEGWYELNTTVTDQKGKYVPAEKSLVVVDKSTDDWTEKSILIVQSVDETTLKSTLVPHNCGTDGETSARALDYGNDRFMLYYTPTGDANNNIKLLPDRKLMLYGKHYYMYELRKGGKVISSQTPCPTDSPNALIPYVSATAQTVTITGENYGEYTGKQFDVLAGTTFRRLVVPSVPATGESDVLPTLDSVYKSLTSTTSTRTYRVKQDDGSYTTETTNVIRPYFLKVIDGNEVSYTYLEPTTAGREEEEWTYGRFSLSTDTTLLASKAGSYYTYDLTKLASTTRFETGGTYYKMYSTATGCINYTKLVLLPASSPAPASSSIYVRVGDLLSSKSFDIYGCSEIRPWRLATCGTTTQFAQGLVDYYDGMSVSDLDIPFYERVAANIIMEGKPVGTYNKDGTLTTVSVSSICNYIEDVFGDGVEGYIDFDNSSNHVYYPDQCYLTGADLTAGETIVMNVFELLDDSHRQVMTVNLIVKQTDVSSNTAVTKRVASFTVTKSDETAEEKTEGVWYAPVGTSIGDWVEKFQPTITYDDGSTSIVPVDSASCYVYGLTSVNTANINKTYEVLFKYFPEKKLNGTLDKQTISSAPKRALCFKKTIKVVNPATVKIRKISILPVWQPDKSYYMFKFATYTTDMETAPEIVDNLGSVIAVADNTKITTANNQYMDDSGVIRPTDDPEANFGYIQHGVIAIYATALGYTNAIYTQPLSVRLNNWLYNSVPVKWLIGAYTDVDVYQESDMPYGNASTNIRPYIEYTVPEGTASDNPKPFKIGRKFAEAAEEKTSASEKLDCFLIPFYYNANPPTITDENADATTDVNSDNATANQPTHFRVRSYTGRTFYEKLSQETATDDKAVADVVYYTEYGKQVTVIVGVTNVSNYIIKAQSELDYYTRSGAGTEASPYVYTKVSGDDKPAAGTVLSSLQRYGWYLKREEEIVTDPFQIDTWNSVTFDLPDAQAANVVTGGSIPVITSAESKYNTLYMGNVFVEFMNITAGISRYLYGVPVETRHPYQISSDPTYVDGTNYYVYVESTNKFKKLTAGTDYTIGGTMNTDASGATMDHKVYVEY